MRSGRAADTCVKESRPHAAISLNTSWISGSRVPPTTEQVGNIGTQLFLSRGLSRPGPPPILQHGACYELKPKQLCEQVAMPGLKRPLVQVEPLPDINNSQQAHFHSPIEDTHSLTCNLLLPQRCGMHANSAFPQSVQPLHLQINPGLAQRPLQPHITCNKI